MSGGLYKTADDSLDKELDLTKLRPYGDTLNDAKVQISFTLPVPADEKGAEAAKLISKKMGIADPGIAYYRALDEGFSFYVIYGAVGHFVNYDEIIVSTVEAETMSMDEVNAYIRDNIKRKIIVIGASTGTDAHTVGIDAIMNMKGFAGNYGLERYEMIEAYNLGSQVTNEEFVKKAIELKADVLLVSQTVTQKDVHISNLTELVEILEAEGIRDRVILVCGGSRITHELAKELGYDAGFGSQKYANDAASFFATEIVKRGLV